MGGVPSGGGGIGRVAAHAVGSRKTVMARHLRTLRELRGNPWTIVAIVGLAEFMVVLDETVVTVALPSIQHDFALDQTNLQWILNAYTLVFGGLLLLGGRAADVVGRKRIFVMGLAIFALASLCDGLAVNAWMLIGSRALQGLGAALVAPAALSIVLAAFSEPSGRAKALAAFATLAIAGHGCGLVLGGVLTQELSWQWIFFINVPIAVVVLVIAARLVSPARGAARHQSMDVVGSLAATTGVVALVCAIINSERHGWIAPATIAFFALAAVLGVGFVYHEKRTPTPIVRIGMFRERRVSIGNVGIGLVMAAAPSTFVFNSLYLQHVLGYRPLVAGLAFLPFTVVCMAVARRSSRLLSRLGIRRLTVGGLIIMAIGLLIQTRAPVQGTYWTNMLPAIVLKAVGMGAVFLPLSLLATTGIKEDHGVASGVFNISQHIGSGLGLAVLTTVAASQIHASKTLPAFVDGFHWAFVASVAFLVVAIALIGGALRREHVRQLELDAWPVAA